MPYVFEILRRLRRELAAEQVPLLGFAGAPFTLAAYLVEGKGSKDFAALKRLMYCEPAVLRALLERLTEMTVELPERADRSGRAGGAALRHLGGAARRRGLPRVDPADPSRPSRGA